MVRRTTQIIIHEYSHKQDSTLIKTKDIEILLQSLRVCPQGWALPILDSTIGLGPR